MATNFISEQVELSLPETNGKNQRSELEKKKSALSDVKNCVTPHTGKSAGRDKIDLNVQQTNLLKNINLFGEDNFDFYDQCLLPAYDDTERAKRFAFSDQDIDNLLDFKYQLYGGLSPPKRPHSPQFEFIGEKPIEPPSLNFIENIDDSFASSTVSQCYGEQVIDDHKDEPLDDSAFSVFEPSLDEEEMRFSDLNDFYMDI